MLRARATQTATLLPDGRVLLAGGCAVDGCSTAQVEPSSEFYVPGRGFVAGPPMVQPRTEPTATVLRDGRILYVGGWAREGTDPLAEAEVYDPVAGEFEKVGSLAQGRGAQTATLLPDGRVLIAGGETATEDPTASVEIFDPATDTFAPGPPLPSPRKGAVAIGLPSGDVLLTGGEIAGKGLTSTLVYDVDKDTWRAGPELSTPRFKHAVARFDHGRVLVIGGTTDDTKLLSSTEIIDPFAGTSTPGPELKEAVYKLGGGVTRDGTGRLVVVAGTEMEVLEPGADAFHRLAGTSGPWRSFATATTLPDGSVLVAGGYDDTIRVQDEAFLVAP